MSKNIANVDGKQFLVFSKPHDSGQGQIRAVVKVGQSKSYENETAMANGYIKMVTEI